ncbi:MAG: ribonuclease HII [bacterium]
MKNSNSKLIAGMDEAGRGSWAGPLVIGCVILKDKNISGITDSKVLSIRKREQLFDRIVASAHDWSIGIAEAYEIDKYGLNTAYFLAVRRTLERLSIKPNSVLFDGRQIKEITYPKINFEFIIGGDSKIKEISAASIIAKVFRDYYILNYEDKYSHYGFKNHKGYGTKEHQLALEKHGALAFHRFSYKPLNKYQKSVNN